MKLKYLLPVATLSTIAATVTCVVSCTKKEQEEKLPVVEIKTSWNGTALISETVDLDTKHSYHIIFDMYDWEDTIPTELAFEAPNEGQIDRDNAHFFIGKKEIAKKHIEWDRGTCYLSDIVLGNKDKLTCEITFKRDVKDHTFRLHV